MTRACILVVLAVLTGQVPLPAQTENVEADPIACWWRTSAGSVRVGEQFGLVLTCSLLETEAMRVLTDESRLEPSVLQLPPFDVIGGTRAKDVTTPGRRFLQYQYEVRLVGEGFFGRDVGLPALQLSYRIENRLAPGASATDAIQGRDFNYALPTLAVRVQSLVPDGATDIRDAPIAGLDEIGRREFRGTVLRMAAGILFVVGGLTAVLAILAMVRRRAAAGSSDRVVSNAAILDRVRRELSAIREERGASGWTSPLAGRALAAMRIAASYAAGWPVRQTRVEADAAAADGEILVNGSAWRGLPRAKSRGAAVISGSVTAGGMSRDGQPSAGRRAAGAAHDDLREGLARFTAARYGREPTLDASRLDESLDRAIETVDQIAASERASRMGRRLADLRGRLWTR